MTVQFTCENNYSFHGNRNKMIKSTTVHALPNPEKISQMAAHFHFQNKFWQEKRVRPSMWVLPPPPPIAGRGGRAPAQILNALPSPPHTHTPHRVGPQPNFVLQLRQIYTRQAFANSKDFFRLVHEKHFLKNWFHKKK